MEGKALPAGIALAGGVGAVDSISQTLATMPPGQLLDIMSQMKVSSRCWIGGGGSWD